ncbi:hypothetical protein LA080_013227 [Diaporthe eres]|nr:hypothetical protein LA080_013227 [Diaporthe eres]
MATRLTRARWKEDEGSKNGCIMSELWTRSAPGLTSARDDREMSRRVTRSRARAEPFGGGIPEGERDNAPQQRKRVANHSIANRVKTILCPAQRGGHLVLLIARAEVGNVAFLGVGEPPVEGSAVSSLISQIHAEPLKPLLNDVPQGTKDDRFRIRLKNKTPAEHVLV